MNYACSNHCYDTGPKDAEAVRLGQLWLAYLMGQISREDYYRGAA